MGALQQVGAVDPERRNSPWQRDPERSYEPLREQLGDEVDCWYFNEQRFADGAEVVSGSVRLRCERGIWVEILERPL